MRVVEIFTSIEGEGCRAGKLCTFVRLAGCNLDCSYCDTDYAQDFGCGRVMSAQEIIEQVCATSLSPYVTLTGGEPLFRRPDEIVELLSGLVARGYEVNIETNGSVDVSPYRQPGVFFTIDYKCPSSGCEDRMLAENFTNSQPEDVIKFVVGSTEDLDAALAVTDRGVNASVFVSPVFGKIELTEIVEYMKNHKSCSDWRMQVQLHKIIWDPQMKGV